MLTDKQVALLKIQAERDMETDSPMVLSPATVLTLLSAHDDAVRLREALDSAARTAHMHNKAFCYGAFEECRNCKEWSAALRPAEPGAGEGE